MSPNRPQRKGFPTGGWVERGREEARRDRTLFAIRASKQSETEDFWPGAPLFDEHRHKNREAARLAFLFDYSKEIL